MVKGVAAGVLGAAAMAWAVRGRSSQAFAPSMWRGDRRRPAVALTFDDGPSESTPEILEILAAHRAPATFFQCGANVKRLPEVARAVRQAGHEIGNHSYSHRLACLSAPAALVEDFGRAQQVIAETTGLAPKLLRAPYGVRWFGYRRAQRRLGLLGVMWTVIGYDWKQTSDAVAERVLGGLVNGAIICLHDGRELGAHPDIRVTVEAVRRLVPAIREQGYRLETVSQLLCPTN